MKRDLSLNYKTLHLIWLTYYFLHTTTAICIQSSKKNPPLLDIDQITWIINLVSKLNRNAGFSVAYDHIFFLSFLLSILLTS